MTRYLTTDTILKSVADTIRAKGKTTEQLTWPIGYNTAINAINPSTISINNIGPYPIITINDAAELNAKQVTVDIEPVQDLHGYASPWPAGGGKNKFDISVSNIVEGSGIASVSGDAVSCTSNNAWATIRYEVNIGAGVYRASIDSITATSDPSRIKLQIAVFAGGSYTSLGYITSVTKSITFTVNEGDVIRISIYTEIADNPFTVSKIQVEAGSTQTSYTPYSNICPITGWTGANVTRTGKNLLDIANTPTGIPRRCSVSVSNNILTATCTEAGGVWVGVTGEVGETLTTVPFGIDAKYGEHICVSTSITIYELLLIELDKNNKIIKSITPVFRNGKSGSYTPTNPNCAKVSLRFSFSTSAAVGDTFSTTIQVEVGSVATAFEPYAGTTIPISWQNTAGTVYGGTLDVTTGVLTVDTVCKVFTGSEATMFGTYATGEAKLPRYAPGDCVSTTDAPCISNMLKKATGYRDLVDNAGTVRIVDASIVIHLDGYQGSSYDRDAFMAELARLYALGNPLEIAYPLATPVTYDLTPQEIALLTGTNHLWADCGDMTLNYFNEDFADLIEEIGTVEGGDY